MAFLGETFDANNVAPSVPFEAVPPGDYTVQIVKSEMAPTKAGTGEMLKLELEIMDGEHAGRKLWDQLNLRNPNQQAVEIAQRTLSAICHAVGKLQVSDSEQLHFVPMIASVEFIPAGTKDKNGYVNQNAKNNVKGYKPAGQAVSHPPAPPAQRTAPPPRQAAPAQAAPPPRATGGAPPWQRRTG